jgi:hypothetical protein
MLIKIGNDEMEWGEDDVLDYLAQYGRVAKEGSLLYLLADGAEPNVGGLRLLVSKTSPGQQACFHVFDGGEVVCARFYTLDGAVAHYLGRLDLLLHAGAA